jgi:hypothetical protein
MGTATGGEEVTRRKRKPEAGVQNAIVDYLRIVRRCPVVIRINSGAIPIPNAGGGFRMFRGADKDTPDLIGMLPGGRFFAFEVKRADGKGRVTDGQREFVENVNANGGVAAIVKSVDEVIETLEGKEST